MRSMSAVRKKMRWRNRPAVSASLVCGLVILLVSTSAVSCGQPTDPVRSAERPRNNDAAQVGAETMTPAGSPWIHVEPPGPAPHLGPRPSRALLQHDFILRNETASRLRVAYEESSCACQSVGIEPEMLAPGEIGIVSLRAPTKVAAGEMSISARFVVADLESGESQALELTAAVTVVTRRFYAVPPKVVFPDRLFEIQAPDDIAIPPARPAFVAPIEGLSVGEGRICEDGGVRWPVTIDWDALSGERAADVIGRFELGLGESIQDGALRSDVLLVWAEPHFVHRLLVSVQGGQMSFEAVAQLPLVERGAVVTPALPWVRVDDPTTTANGMQVRVRGDLPPGFTQERIVVDHSMPAGRLVRVIFVLAEAATGE